MVLLPFSTLLSLWAALVPSPGAFGLGSNFLFLFPFLLFSLPVPFPAWAVLCIPLWCVLKLPRSVWMVLVGYSCSFVRFFGGARWGGLLVLPVLMVQSCCPALGCAGADAKSLCVTGAF